MNEETPIGSTEADLKKAEPVAPTKILLVEDDPALRLVLKNVLEMNDYTVLEADSKASAEVILREDIRYRSSSIKFFSSFLKEFLKHAFAYVIIVPLLVLSNWLFAPEQMWSGLAALGWGTWLAVEAFRVFEAGDFLGPQWERRQLEKRRGDPRT